MTTPFQIFALERERVSHLLSANAGDLAASGGRWVVVDATPGYPCRVSLEDAEVGERALLIPFVHHDVDSPYRASGPIYVRENASTRRLAVNEVPRMLERRQLSIRAYSKAAMMVAAQVVNGLDLRDVIPQLLEPPEVEYLHVHNAGPGCFNCAVRAA
jgi:hypothetical protein